MKVLHLLCLDPNATPEMLKLLANACPQVVTMQAEMVANVELDEHPCYIADETHEMVTQIKFQSNCC